MTIPITPGPFSFLATLGQGVGNAFSEHEKDRQQKIKEARDVLNQMLDLRQKELIDPSAFSSPQAMKVYQTLGITPVSDQPTTGEQLSGITGQYLHRIAPSLGTGTPQEDELRAMAKLPSRATGPQVEAERAIAGAQVPTANLQGATAAAQIPGAGMTAVAGQQGEQDKQFNDIATRVVADLYTKTGKLPTSRAAWEAGLGDVRNAFGPNVTEPYYGQAIEALRAAHEKELSYRIAAMQQHDPASQLPQLARVYQTNISTLQTKLDNLRKINGVRDGDEMAADMAQKAIAEGRKVPAFMQAAADRWSKYQTEASDLQSQIDQYSNKLNAVVGPAIGVTTPTSGSSPTIGEKNRDAAAREFERRTKGITDPARRKAIGEQIAREYNIRSGQ